MANKYNIFLSIVIPCFNEEKRLGKFFPVNYQYIKKNFSSFEFILVNDGSTDKTVKVLQNLAKKFSGVKVVTYKKNSGKGYALKKGVEIAKGEIIGLMDADFSINIEESKKFIKEIEDGADICIGDRRFRKGVLGIDFKRRFLGNLLTMVNSFFLDLGEIKDSQCGFKFFKRDVARELFSDLKIWRWLFDLEILLVAREKNFKIVKLGVKWEQIEGSKVNPIKDFWQVFEDLFKIYFNFMNLRTFLLIFFAGLFILLLPFFQNPQGLTRRAGDFSDLVYPDYFYIKNVFLNYHQVPLWNWSVFSGIPEIANPQSPLIYLPNYLSLVLPIDLSIIFLIFLHGLLAAIFIFLLTKKLFKFSTFGVLVSSFLFVFSPFIWSRASVGHLSAFFADCLVAPIMYFGVKLFQRAKVVDFILLSFFLANQYLNYPTLWYYTVIFGALSFGYLCLTEKNLRKIFIPVLSPALSIILIVPVFLIQYQTSKFITRSSLSLNELSIPVWSIKNFLASVFIPSNFLGSLDNEVWLYPGLVGLFLTFLGFFKLPKKIKVLFSVILAFVILITLGSRTPAFTILANYLPGFSYLRVSTRDWIVFISTIALVSGLMVEKMGTKLKCIFLILVVLDSFIFSYIRLANVPKVMVQVKSSPIESLLQNSDPMYRYYCTSRCISPGFSEQLGIKTADGYHILIFKNYQDALSLAGGFSPPPYSGNIPGFDDFNAQPNAYLLGNFSVKWVISKNPLKDPQFVMVKKSGSYMLYQNLKALPILRFENEKENRLEVLKMSPDEVIMRTFGKEDKLIYADNFSPGWAATVNGREVKIKLWNGWAKSVDVPEGINLVEFNFR